MPSFETNRDLTIDARGIGQSGEPLLIIDDFLAEPAALVAAAHMADWHEVAPGGYPGRRAALPGGYARAVLRRLDAPIRKRLVGPDLRLGKFECSFSMVTRAPGALSTRQRVPHIDVARDSRVAVLHYLCGPGFGGTAFFRQDATGLEQVPAQARATYLAASRAEQRALGAAPAYPGAQTPGYTRTDFVEARFNRLVVYRSFTLHSGIIEDADRLSPDPGRGRLTTTFFVDYAPPG